MTTLTANERIARRIWLADNLTLLTNEVAYYKTHLVHFRNGIDFQALLPTGELKVY